MALAKVINNLDKESLELITRTLKAGKLVAVPTETVYGLAADAMNEKAVGKIFETKGRPADNPLIVHVANIDKVYEFAREIPERLFRALADKFWPGPLTIILKKVNTLPMITTGGLDSVAIRIPSHPMILKILEDSQLGLAAPSANLSGKPSPTTAQHCIDDIGDKVDIIVDGGPCSFGVESTVISLAQPIPTILRPGVITKEEIEEVIGEVKLSKYILEPAKEEDKVISPGVKYRHYSPEAEIVLVKSSLEGFANYISSIELPGVAALVFDGEEKFIDKPCFTYGKESDYLSQTKNLFGVLRDIDTTDFKTVYVRCPSKEGVSLSVYNRLIRAAGFNVIELGE